MSKNDKLAEQSLKVQQNFFGVFTDAGYDLGTPVPPQPNVPMPACLQLHIPPGSTASSVGFTEFDTQSPHGLPVFTTLEEGIDDIRYKKPNPEEEIQKLREQFKELITDNARGTYKRGHNGQLIADEVCVEGLIDDLVEFFTTQ